MAAFTAIAAGVTAAVSIGTSVAGAVSAGNARSAQKKQAQAQIEANLAQLRQMEEQLITETGRQVQIYEEEAARRLGAAEAGYAFSGVEAPLYEMARRRERAQEDVDYMVSRMEQGLANIEEQRQYVEEGGAAQVQGIEAAAAAEMFGAIGNIAMNAFTLGSEVYEPGVQGGLWGGKPSEMAPIMQGAVGAGAGTSILGSTAGATAGVGFGAGVGAFRFGG